MKNKLFYTKKFLDVHTKIVDFLNGQSEEKLGIKNSVREIGDRVGKILAENFEQFVGDFGKNWNVDPSHKKLANVTFNDEEGFTYFIDVITHNITTKFSRPNITSVDRLAKIYENDKNVFVVLVVEYNPSKKSDWFTNVVFLPIEFISWESLDFGLLGLGQIQIRKASEITGIIKNSRKSWMLQFGRRLNRFYVEAADKIVGQLRLSNNIQDNWEVKTDTW